MLGNHFGTDGRSLTHKIQRDRPTNPYNGRGTYTAEQPGIHNGHGDAGLLLNPATDNVSVGYRTSFAGWDFGAHYTVYETRSDGITPGAAAGTNASAGNDSNPQKVQGLSIYKDFDKLSAYVTATEADHNGVGGDQRSTGFAFGMKYDVTDTIGFGLLVHQSEWDRSASTASFDEKGFVAGINYKLNSNSALKYVYSGGSVESQDDAATIDDDVETHKLEFAYSMGGKMKLAMGLLQSNVDTQGIKKDVGSAVIGFVTLGSQLSYGK